MTFLKKLLKYILALEDKECQQSEAESANVAISERKKKILAAVVDEYIQLFSLGRDGKVMDVLLDFSGALCAWLWYRIVQWCD